MAELDLLPGDKSNPIHTLLRMTATGLTIASSAAAPNILLLLAKHVGINKERSTLRKIQYAKTKGWLTFEDTPDGTKVALSARGYLKWQQIELNRPLQAKRWDGKWRVVLFDIPVTKKKPADAFRAGLKKLGLKQLQRSVWVTPFVCQAQISALRQMYRIKNHVRIAELISVEDEASLKAQFKLS